MSNAPGRIRALLGGLPTHFTATAALLPLVLFVFAGVDLVPFHPDEAIYIRMSRDYDYLIRNGDLKRILYSRNPPEGRQERDIRVTIGSIHIFAIGLARHVSGLGVETNRFWLWDNSPEEADEVWQRNIARGSYPDATLLRTARYVSTLFGACALIPFFLAVHELTRSRLAAAIACLLLSTSPLFLVHVRRAMQEGSKMFFLCICLYFAVRVVRSFPRFSIKEFLLLGISTGFTLAAKQDTAAAIAAIYTAILLIPWIGTDRFRHFSTQLRYTAAATCVALALFLGLMPVFWEWWKSILLLLCLAAILFWSISTLYKRLTVAAAGLLLILTLVSPSTWTRLPGPFQILATARERVVAAQVRYRERNDLPVMHSLSARARFLGKTVFYSGTMDLVSGRLMVAARSTQVDAYMNSIVSGRHHLILLDVVLAAFFMLGTLRLFRTWSPGSLLVCSLFAVTSVILILTVPLAFDRYFLILQIPYCLICALGMQSQFT